MKLHHSAKSLAHIACVNEPLLTLMQEKLEFLSMDIYYKTFYSSNLTSALDKKKKGFFSIETGSKQILILGFMLAEEL